MDVYAQFLAAADKAGTIGSMIWSLRPHSARGGFKTHREDAENAAYHAPGWPNPLVDSPSPKPVNWDEKEYPIIKMIREASYRINKERLPKLHPIPTAPYVWSNKNGTISWRCAAWALKYEAWMAPSSISGRDWKRIGVNITDAVDEGQAIFTLPPNSRGLVKMRGISVEGVNGEWSNAVKI